MTLRDAMIVLIGTGQYRIDNTDDISIFWDETEEEYTVFEPNGKED